MDFLTTFVLILYAIIGGVPTLAIIAMLFGTLGYKIYRTAKYGISFFD